MSSASRAKSDRERQRRARAELKREQKAAKAEGGRDDEDAVFVNPGTKLSADELLQAVASLHQQFASEAITFEDFEEQKSALMAQIDVS